MVHPNCYRRELYDQDDEDESPWYCARCTHLLKDSQTLHECFLCNDKQGAVIDLKTKEWVHIACVNWINEIWFEEQDVSLAKFGGELDFDKFQLICYLC